VGLATDFLSVPAVKRAHERFERARSESARSKVREALRTRGEASHSDFVPPFFNPSQEAVMQFNITFRNLDATDALKDYARDRVERVNKYVDRPTEAHVVLSLERYLHHADIGIHAGRFFLRGREKSPDMYASIDLAMDKIERQLKRYKEKLKTQHKGAPHHNAEPEPRMQHKVIQVSDDHADDTAPRIIKSSEFVAKPMGVTDAVMQMDLMGNDFLVFTNTATIEINVLYRRKDGHYGLIEPRQVREASN
jgi:putative sigma-54 modulation protein